MIKNKHSYSNLYLAYNKLIPDSKRSQIWVETAIYTLIGLTIIVIILAIANPQIEKIKDRSSIRQAMEAIETLEGKVSEVEQSPGSVGLATIRIGKGKIIINSTNNSINYILEDTSLEFSQQGINIKEGNFIVRTEKKGNKFRIILNRYYTGLEMTYNGQERDNYLEPGAVPYKIRMENKGKNTLGDKTIIDFSRI